MAILTSLGMEDPFVKQDLSTRRFTDVPGEGASCRRNRKYKSQSGWGTMSEKGRKRGQDVRSDRRQILQGMESRERVLLKALMWSGLLSLRHNSHVIKFTLLKCTIHGVLA